LPSRSPTRAPPILLLLLRIMQGAAIGGEAPGAPGRSVMLPLELVVGGSTAAPRR
jgi:hypothetical protein